MSEFYQWSSLSRIDGLTCIVVELRDSFVWPPLRKWCSVNLGSFEYGNILVNDSGKFSRVILVKFRSRTDAMRFVVCNGIDRSFDTPEYASYRD